jgi:predicted TIM-barrel fold metal-dependent hydrolase
MRPRDHGPAANASASRAFYDVHCHALTLSHPNFLAYVDTVRHRRLESIYSQALSPNYLVSALFMKGGERMRNMLAVMENDVGSLFALMEDDLSGVFAKKGDPEPLLGNGKLAVSGLCFDRLVLCPLIMDFHAEGERAPRIGLYYDRPASKPVAVQVRDLLEGIRDYRRARPAGFLEIRPFLGVDTRHYSIEELASLLERAFSGFSRDRARAAATFDAMRDYDEAAPPPCLFAGIKVYPPLGFDPWPAEGPGREKAKLLWSFCERRGLPVVSHCDDQGFRVVGLEEAWKRTSPARWSAVLKRHPELRIDFAHFGMQYVRMLGKPPSTEWTDRIAGFALDYPNVYADFSFNGTEPDYYRWLSGYLGSIGAGRAKRLRERLLFGSDFPVNLTKVRSYSDYYRIFADSGLSDEEKRRFTSDNPERFLFG